MKNNRTFVLSIIIVLLSFGSSSIIQAQQPRWSNGYFEEFENSYVEVATGLGSTIEQARNKAVEIIMQKRSLATGSRAKISIADGDISVSSSDELTVTARILDEQAKQIMPGQWQVTLLVQTAKHPSIPYDAITITDEYPFSVRAFVPGMEQLHKGQKTKGILFIAGEVACVGGIVIAENMRLSNENLIKSTHNAKHRADYTDDANNWGNIRNGFIAAAAAVYVWNVIDAATSKGARHVTLALAPFATLETTGLALSINL